MLVTRFAPTPSGYLHAGNVVNLVLTDWHARAHGGRLLLRIDDFDLDRVRQAYIEDVFRTLDWLDIDITSGPSGPTDFRASWSMLTLINEFREARDRLIAGAGTAAFVCRCSRRELSRDVRCVLGCSDRRLTLVPGESVLRLSVPATQSGGDLPDADHVMWRRDDLPSYQLGSVVADEALGVTSVVRGMDLLASSALQVHLAQLLPAPGFAAADLRHHELLTGPTGLKLSKRAGAQAQPMEHTSQLRDQVRDWAQALGASLGILRP